MMEYLSLLDIVRDMELIGIERHITVLYLYRTGRGCDEELTQVQCAEILGVSTSTAREIEDNALMKLYERLCNEHND